MATFINDDEYEVPLRDQRYFGSGLKRKRVKFVPSVSTTESAQSAGPASSVSVADRYRAAVLKQNVADASGNAAPDLKPKLGLPLAETAVNESAPECEVCHRPIRSNDSTVAHHSSIAHQICLQHSYPPSHLDRGRKGLALLESQGWDPDSRQGLGSRGDGMRYPIKATENPKRVGLGMRLAPLKAVEKPVKLDAGKVRMMEKEGKKKADRLRESFHRSEDVVRYLGE